MPKLVPLPYDLPSYEERVSIASGKIGTAQTIEAMRSLVDAGKRDWEIRKLLGKILRDENVQPKKYYDYAEACYKYCRDKMLYVFDPNQVELIENPSRLLESGVADCDSIVVLLASLLECAGMPCRFVTIKADPKRDEFSHVFLEVNIPGKGWTGADATMPNHDFGWEPPAIYPRKNWPASHDDSESDEGTSGMISGVMNGLAIVQEAPAVSVLVNRFAQMTFSEVNEGEDATQNEIEDHVAGMSGFGDYSTVEAQFNQVWDGFMGGVYANPWSQSSAVRGQMDSLHSQLVAFQNKILPQVKSGQMSEAAAVSQLQGIASAINGIVPTVQAMSTSSDNPAKMVAIPIQGGNSVTPDNPGNPVSPKSNAMWWLLGGTAVIGLAVLLLTRKGSE